MLMGNLEELRKVHREMKELSAVMDSAQLQEHKVQLWEAMGRVMNLARIARAEGLLALEEALEKGSAEEEPLKQMVTLVLDGNDPETILGIGWTRYYVGLYTDFEALRHLLYLEGALSIQAGINPRVLEEKLKTMLSPDMYKEYSRMQEQKYIEEENTKQENLIECLCKGKRLWNSMDQGYYVSKLLDYVLCDISGKDLQRALREIENTTLSLAMKGMSGAARSCIFANLSERLGQMVAEGMVNMGPVRAVDIMEATQKILAIIIRLVEKGEIPGNYDYLAPFLEIVYVNTEDKLSKYGKIEALRNLLDEYEQSENLVEEFAGEEE